MLYKDLEHSVQRRLDQIYSEYRGRLNVVIYDGQPLDHELLPKLPKPRSPPGSVRSEQG